MTRNYLIGHYKQASAKVLVLRIRTEKKLSLKVLTTKLNEEGQWKTGTKGNTIGFFPQLCQEVKEISKSEAVAIILSAGKGMDQQDFW